MTCNLHYVKYYDIFFMDIDRITFYRNYHVVVRYRGLSTLVSPELLRQFIGERCYKSVVKKMLYMHYDKVRIKFRNGYVVDVYAK